MPEQLGRGGLRRPSPGGCPRPGCRPVGRLHSAQLPLTRLGGRCPHRSAGSEVNLAARHRDGRQMSADPTRQSAANLVHAVSTVTTWGDVERDAAFSGIPLDAGGRDPQFLRYLLARHRPHQIVRLRITLHDSHATHDSHSLQGIHELGRRRRRLGAADSANRSPRQAPSARSVESVQPAPVHRTSGSHTRSGGINCCTYCCSRSPIRAMKTVLGRIAIPLACGFTRTPPGTRTRNTRIKSPPWTPPRLFASVRILDGTRVVCSGPSAGVRTVPWLIAAVIAAPELRTRGLRILGVGSRPRG